MMDGNRWYDNTKIIWGLFAIVGALLATIGGLITYIVAGHAATLTDHAARIGKLEAANLVVVEQLRIQAETLKDIRADLREIRAEFKR